MALRYNIGIILVSRSTLKMSFLLNKNHQLSLGDSFNNLSDRGKRFVLNSWASDFADNLFPAINEERFKVLYSSNSATRPNTPVNVLFGAMILKEIQQVTDDELLASVICDVRYQYALHTTSFDEQPLSDRSFSRFRERCYLYEMETGRDLIKEETLSLAKEIEKQINLNPSMQRMDSLMVASNCKKMTRLEILYTCLANMAKAIHKTGEETLLSGLEHYLNENDRNNVIYHTKSDGADSKIQQIIDEATKLISEMGDAYFEFSEYKLLCRVLEEQSNDSGDGTRKAKDKKDITPDSLQNPSDPDATYRKKAGKAHTGYVANIVESFDENGNSVITDYSYEQNSHSDSDFCKEVIESVGHQEETLTLIADGAYDSTDNKQTALEKNIRLVTTNLTGQLPDPIHSEFVMSDGVIVICPEGHAPLRATLNASNGMCRAVFEKEQCENCQYSNQCNIKQQRETVVVNVSEKMVERSQQMKNMETGEFKELASKRNAVEGIPSILRRRYNVDSIPVRGRLFSKLFFGFKIAAANTKKMIKRLRLRDDCIQNAVLT